MGWLNRLLGREQDDEAAPLYAAVVAAARQPHWYVEGAVPDTLDGRFDMVAAVLSAVLVRLEAEPAGARPAVALAERFVDDMDAQVRQIGFGDIVVGKQIGRMMAALGGRLGAYRDGLQGDDAALRAALVRNLYRGEAPAAAALAHTASHLRALHAGLAAVPVPRLIEGALA